MHDHVMNLEQVDFPTTSGLTTSQIVWLNMMNTLVNHVNVSNHETSHSLEADF